ncbi:hypothetical protein [Limnohabitans radicicola]|uniref:Haemolysin-type calcium binding-related domain-containing protein n=1 Tax=Limnohabitans radicicola TaxID=2771427 RepID=A0A927IL95_9BURK|nr:hypothetical protein [Limnohabitans radicicola]MBD8049687.1 hypothetical protein [Limnohabitans radicicola]
MPTQIYLVNSPSNTQKTLLGTNAKDDYIKLDRSAVTSTFSLQVLSGIHFTVDWQPVYLVSDVLYKTSTLLSLPALNSANAIEAIALIGSTTQVFDGLYKIAKPGDYSLSAEPYLMIGTNDEASTLSGQNNTNSVAIIVGGAGNDQITGSAGSSVLYGMEGNNTLISRGAGFDYIRGFASMNANDTIRVESTLGSHMLQIYMGDPSPKLVYLEKVGADLVGKITNSSGESYSFRVIDQYAGKPLQNLNIYAAPTSTASITASTTGIYLGGDLTEAKITPTARALAIGDSQSNVFDYRLSDRAGANVFGNDGNDIVYSKVGFHAYFYGGGGTDTMVYANNYADYTLKLQTATYAKVTAAGETIQDWLYNAEILQFKDQSIYLMADGTTRTSLDASKGQQVYFGGDGQLITGTGTSSNTINYELPSSNMTVLANTADKKTLLIKTSTGMDLVTNATDFVFTDGSKTLASLLAAQTNIALISTATLNSSDTLPTWAVTGVSAATAVRLAQESQITAIQVTDSTANVTLALDNLNMVASKLTGIALSDSQPMGITGAQLLKDQTVLAKISGSYTTNLPSYNIVNGSPNNDSILGTFGNDYLKGGAGTDQIAGFSGNDLVDGGDGNDTLVLGSSASKYKLDMDASGTVSVQNKTTGDTVSAINIENIKFQDKTISIERQTHSSYADVPESLWHFFIVAFNAAPGVTYMDQLAAAYRYGLTIKQIVDIFTTKPQFTNTYPTTLSTQELAINLVNNIVKDSASAAVKQQAVNDIMDAMNLVHWTVGDVIYQVFGNLATLPQTDASWGRTAKQFANEIAVAKTYTDTLNQSTVNLGTLKSILAPISADTDVSSYNVVVNLIGMALIDSTTLG